MIAGTPALGRGLPTRRGQAGFTLIELLVVLVLIGFISAALIGGLRFGARSWETVRERNDWVTEIVTVQSLLRRQVAEIPPPARRRGDTDLSLTVFYGSEFLLEFATLYPRQRALGGRHFFELEIVDGESAKKLELRWRLYHADGAEYQDGEGREERILIEGIEAAKFSYFGVLGDEEEARWHESWEEQPFLPELVRLELTFPPEDQRYWPELIVATASTAANARPR